MKELFEASISWTSLPFTVLLALVCLYWLVVILGFIDMEAFDFLGDFDVDADTHADVHHDVGSNGQGSVFSSVLHIFQFADVPLMIPVSLFSISLWVVSVLSNFYLNPMAKLGTAALILVANLVVSALVMRVVAKPFALLFRKLNVDRDKHVQIVGSVCTLISSLSGDRMGQAEVYTGESPITLNVMKKNGPDLKKGDEAAVLEFDQNKKVYLVKSLNL